MITVAILNPGGKRKQADVNAKITCLINHREQMVAIRFSKRKTREREKEEKLHYTFRIKVAARILSAIIQRK